MEEEVNNRSKAAESERSKRITASKTLQATEDELAKAKADLITATRKRDSALSGLTGAQKQAKDQTKRLLIAKNQLKVAKELIEDLNKKLATAEHDKGVVEYARDEAQRARWKAKFARKEAETAKDTAEEDSYNAGVAETQAILKVQIPGVCRLYCSQVWEEALKRAGVDVSSDLWKAENIFYPAAIREAPSSSSMAEGKQPGVGVIQPEGSLIGNSLRKRLKEGDLPGVLEVSQQMDHEAPTEVTEPVGGSQLPGVEEPTISAKPPQAVPIAVVTKSTGSDPAQPSLVGTIPQGAKADSASPSQDVADAQPKK